MTRQQVNSLQQLISGLRKLSFAMVPAAWAMAGLIHPAWAGASPFEISVDDQPVAGSAPADAAQSVDGDLAKMDIQLKFDGLGVRPLLNVSTMPVRAAYTAGEEIRFLASWNYGAFVKRAEIRIYERGSVRSDHPLIVIPVTPLGAATWVMPDKGPNALDYVVRVYDEANRFDQTKPLPLNRIGKLMPPQEAMSEAVAPGYGEDRTDVRNIPVYGGAVTVSGRNVPAGHAVTVMGEPVPIDNDNRFVAQRILPVGKHTVDISVMQQGQGLTFSREIDIPSTEWFYVGQAELTARYRTGSSHIEDVSPGEYRRVYMDGHLAFYLKGKIKGEYLLTASADSGEGHLIDLFRGLDGKSPREYLRRIDPSTYYPVYGDDSTSIEDAPTRGKFYIRLDKGPSHVMWGTFKSNITGTRFLANDRELYGASGVYRSDAVTSFGETKTAGDVYVAQPGTLPQRDMFRATGGSAYFLSHADLTPGSETVTVQVRSSVTGAVIDSRTLVAGQDYAINYVQGLVMLSRPLPSTSPSGDGNYLSVTYEYTPVSGDVKGYAYGGRAQQWLGEHVRVGATGEIEKAGGANQKMAGADARLQVIPNTYIDAEVARSQGPGFSNTFSSNGGLDTQNIGSADGESHTAYAYSVKAHSNLDSLTAGRAKGDLDAYFVHQQKNFSTLSENADATQTGWGAKGDLQLSDRAKPAAGYEELHSSGGQFERKLTGKTDFALGQHWTVTPSVKFDDLKEAATDPLGVANPNASDGHRDDGRLTAAYNWNKDDSAYVFGQKTFYVTGTRERDDRAGVGGSKRLSEKVTLGAEVSYGDLGPGGKAMLEYAPTVDDRYYVGYTLDQDRAFDGSYPYTLQGSDLGAIVGGVKHRLNDRVTVFGEDGYDMFGRLVTLSQTYGVTYTPDKRWNLTGSGEVGRVYDDRSVDIVSGQPTGSLRREALSLMALYKDENGIDGKLKGEVRHDHTDATASSGDGISTGPSNTMSYLFSGGLGVKTSENWRALASLDTVISTSSDDTKKGSYVEGSLGYAYRPAEGDRWNALFKYTFLYDHPGPDQVSFDGTTDGPLQTSHIFAADVMYDLNQYLTIGGKIGLRIGETKLRTTTDSAGDPPPTWMKSTAGIAILRADVHVVHNWDALLEARVLHLGNGNSTHFGIVGAIYRHMTDNLKLGVGYNFGTFSDDLRDQTLNDEGVFVNLLGEW